MTNNQECALNKSLSVAGGDQTRSQSAHVTAAGLRARPPRPTAGSARRHVIGAALAFAAVFGGIAGVGVVGVAGEASAKPMRDTTNNGVCTEINQELRLEQRFLTEMNRIQAKAMLADGPITAARDQLAADVQVQIKETEKTIKYLEGRARANGC